MSGLILFPVIFIYIFVSFIISKLIKCFIVKKYLAKYIFLFLLIFPFSDLILIHIGMFFYKPFVHYTIYEYPELNKNNKLESLDANIIGYTFFDSYFDEKTLNEFISNTFPNIKEKVEDFIELPKNIHYKNKLGEYIEEKYFVKINFNKNNNFIDINTVSQGRFTQIIKEETKNNYLFVYTKGQTIIFDKKLNKVLASNPIFFIEGNSILMGIRNSIFVMGGSQSPIFRGAGIIHSGEKEMLKEIFNIEGLI